MGSNNEGAKKHYRSCNLCEAMCGIEVSHKDGQILSIKGDKLDPFSRGHICPKAVALKDLYEDPDRLRQPMERTENGWREISWDSALDKAAQGLMDLQKRYGNDALAIYQGNPNVHNTGAILYGKQLHGALRTRSRYSATSADQLPHQMVSYHLFGHQLKIPVPDIDRCKYFMIIGGNPLASNGSIMTVPDVKKRLQAIKSNGGKIVVIDPRKTETAELASEHYFIKPGSDVLLLLAMVHLLFKNSLVAPGKLKSYLSDLDEIEPYVAAYPPERVADITGIAVDQIEKLTMDFASAKNAVCYGRLGVSVQPFGLLCQYLIMLLNILTGRLDHSGGMMFTKPAVSLLGQMSPGSVGRRYSRVRGLPEVGGELPVATLAEEIDTEGEGQLKGLVTVAGNPVLSTPNGTQLDCSLAKLDFMVSIDFYLNETTRHANIILPPVSPLEREHYDLVFHMLAVRNSAKYSPALFPIKNNSKHDWEIFLELAKRMNPAKTLRDKAAWLLSKKTGPKGLLSLLLMTGDYGGRRFFKALNLRKLKQHPHGVDLGPLQSCFPDGIYHKDKKIHLELDFYMADLARVEREFYSDKKDSREFSLIGRRDIRSNNSWLHNSHRLVKGKNRCTAYIHPDSADKVGFLDGQKLRVESRVGTVDIEAEITDKIMPGVISIPHGWGHGMQIGLQKNVQQKIASQRPGVSVNDLTDDSVVDELSGCAVLNAVPVSVQVIASKVST